MQNSRRIARELALKILFQVDVGKQPLEEVIEGALGQIRQTVDQPVGQVVHEARAALRKLAAERSGDMSSASARQMKLAVTAAVTDLQKLSSQLAVRAQSLTEKAVQSEVDSLDTQHDEIVRLAHLDAEAARTLIRRIGSRESSYPQVLAEIVEDAESRAEQMETAFNRHSRTAAAAASFLRHLVQGVTDKQAEIDQRISELSAGWALERQAAVDRNILRLAAFEILFDTEIPPAASINEAVELAKKYSTAESGRFVNGVLGALATQHTLPTDDADVDAEPHAELMVAESSEGDPAAA